MSSGPFDAAEHKIAAQLARAVHIGPLDVLRGIFATAWDTLVHRHRETR